jgi:predicted transposase/invertase (TIGR01784 family)
MPTFERLDPLNDYLFQKVMGEKGDEKQLIAFLNAVLIKTGGNNLASIEIVSDTKLTAEILGGKQSVLDVRAVTDKGDKINIEVQLANEGNMDKRSLYYWSREFVRGISEGESYKKLPKVIAINIVDFELIKAIDDFHTSFHIREDDRKDYVLTDALEIHFLDMQKFRRLKNCDRINNPIHRWLAYFDKTTDDKTLEEIIKMDTAIATANDKMIRVTSDKEVLRAYQMRQMAISDKVSGLEYAREEGEKRAAKQIARQLKNLSILSLEQIGKATGLSTQEIEAL